MIVRGSLVDEEEEESDTTLACTLRQRGGFNPNKLNATL
jgi:hypothetical protein